VPRGTGTRRRLNSFVYGGGLCFGMAALALALYRERYPGAPLVERPPEPELLEMVREWHVRQFYPRCVRSAVRYWLTALGGRPEYASARLRLPDASDDPHVLCFGPKPNLQAARCFLRAHAVAPYRLEREEGLRRVYVYDPNFPQDPNRYITFYKGGVEFDYGGFASAKGWGITLIPISAAADTRYGSHSRRRPAVRYTGEAITKG
jgi:hypothetical protein